MANHSYIMDYIDNQIETQRRFVAYMHEYFEPGDCIKQLRTLHHYEATRDLVSDALTGNGNVND